LAHELVKNNILSISHSHWSGNSARSQTWRREKSACTRGTSNTSNKKTKWNKAGHERK